MQDLSFYGHLKAQIQSLLDLGQKASNININIARDAYSGLLEEFLNRFEAVRKNAVRGNAVLNDDIIETVESLSEILESVALNDDVYIREALHFVTIDIILTLVQVIESCIQVANPFSFISTLSLCLLIFENSSPTLLEPKYLPIRVRVIECLSAVYDSLGCADPEVINMDPTTSGMALNLYSARRACFLGFSKAKALHELIVADYRVPRHEELQLIANCLERLMILSFRFESFIDVNAAIGKLDSELSHTNSMNLLMKAVSEALKQKSFFERQHVRSVSQPRAAGTSMAFQAVHVNALYRGSSSLLPSQKRNFILDEAKYSPLEAKENNRVESLVSLLFSSLMPLLTPLIPLLHEFFGAMRVQTLRGWAESLTVCDLHDIASLCNERSLDLVRHHNYIGESEYSLRLSPEHCAALKELFLVFPLEVHEIVVGSLFEFGYFEKASILMHFLEFRAFLLPSLSALGLDVSSSSFLESQLVKKDSMGDRVVPVSFEPSGSGNSALVSRLELLRHVVELAQGPMTLPALEESVKPLQSLEKLSSKDKKNSVSDLSPTPTDTRRMLSAGISPLHLVPPTTAETVALVNLSVGLWTHMRARKSGGAHAEPELLQAACVALLRVCGSFQTQRQASVRSEAVFAALGALEESVEFAEFTESIAFAEALMHRSRAAMLRGLLPEAARASAKSVSLLQQLRDKETEFKFESTGRIAFCDYVQSNENPSEHSEVGQFASEGVDNSKKAVRKNLPFVGPQISFFRRRAMLLEAQLSATMDLGALGLLSPSLCDSRGNASRLQSLAARQLRTSSLHAAALLQRFELFFVLSQAGVPGTADLLGLEGPRSAAERDVDEYATSLGMSTLRQLGSSKLGVSRTTEFHKLSSRFADGARVSQKPPIASNRLAASLGQTKGTSAGEIDSSVLQSVCGHNAAWCALYLIASVGFLGSEEARGNALSGAAAALRRAVVLDRFAAAAAAGKATPSSDVDNEEQWGSFIMLGRTSTNLTLAPIAYFDAPTNNSNKAKKSSKEPVSLSEIILPTSTTPMESFTMKENEEEEDSALYDINRGLAADIKGDVYLIGRLYERVAPPLPSHTKLEGLAEPLNARRGTRGILSPFSRSPTPSNPGAKLLPAISNPFNAIEGYSYNSDFHGKDTQLHDSDNFSLPDVSSHALGTVYNLLPNQLYQFSWMSTFRVSPAAGEDIFSVVQPFDQLTSTPSLPILMATPLPLDYIWTLLAAAARRCGALAHAHAVALRGARIFLQLHARQSLFANDAAVPAPNSFASQARKSLKDDGRAETFNSGRLVLYEAEFNRQRMLRGGGQLLSFESSISFDRLSFFRSPYTQSVTAVPSSTSELLKSTLPISLRSFLLPLLPQRVLSAAAVALQALADAHCGGLLGPLIASACNSNGMARQSGVFRLADESTAPGTVAAVEAFPAVLAAPAPPLAVAEAGLRLESDLKDSLSLDFDPTVDSKVESVLFANQTVEDLQLLREITEAAAGPAGLSLSLPEVRRKSVLLALRLAALAAVPEVILESARDLAMLLRARTAHLLFPNLAELASTLGAQEQSPPVSVTSINTNQKSKMVPSSSSSATPGSTTSLPVSKTNHHPLLTDSLHHMENLRGYTLQTSYFELRQLLLALLVARKASGGLLAARVASEASKIEAFALREVTAFAMLDKLSNPLHSSASCMNSHSNVSEEAPGEPLPFLQWYVQVVVSRDPDGHSATVKALEEEKEVEFTRLHDLSFASVVSEENDANSFLSRHVEVQDVLKYIGGFTGGTSAAVLEFLGVDLTALAARVHLPAHVQLALTQLNSCRDEFLKSRQGTLSSPSRPSSQKATAKRKSDVSLPSATANPADVDPVVPSLLQLQRLSLAARLAGLSDLALWSGLGPHDSSPRGEGASLPGWKGSLVYDIQRLLGSESSADSAAVSARSGGAEVPPGCEFLVSNTYVSAVLAADFVRSEAFAEALAHFRQENADIDEILADKAPQTQNSGSPKDSRSSEAFSPPSSPKKGSKEDTEKKKPGKADPKNLGSPPAVIRKQPPIGPNAQLLHSLAPRELLNATAVAVAHAGAGAAAVLQSSLPTLQWVRQERAALQSVVSPAPSQPPSKPGSRSSTRTNNERELKELNTVGVDGPIIMVDNAPVSHGPGSDDKMDMGLGHPSQAYPSAADLEAVKRNIVEVEKLATFLSSGNAHFASLPLASALRVVRPHIAAGPFRWLLGVKPAEVSAGKVSSEFGPLGLLNHTVKEVVEVGSSEYLFLIGSTALEYVLFCLQFCHQYCYGTSRNGTSSTNSSTTVWDDDFPSLEAMEVSFTAESHDPAAARLPQLFPSLLGFLSDRPSFFRRIGTEQPTIQESHTQGASFPSGSKAEFGTSSSHATAVAAVMAAARPVLMELAFAEFARATELSFGLTVPNSSAIPKSRSYDRSEQDEDALHHALTEALIAAGVEAPSIGPRGEAIPAPFFDVEQKENKVYLKGYDDFRDNGVFFPLQPPFPTSASSPNQNALPSTSASSSKAVRSFFHDETHFSAHFHALANAAALSVSVGEWATACASVSRGVDFLRFLSLPPSLFADCMRDRSDSSQSEQSNDSTDVGLSVGGSLFVLSSVAMITSYALVSAPLPLSRSPLFLQSVSIQSRRAALVFTLPLIPPEHLMAWVDTASIPGRSSNSGKNGKLNGPENPNRFFAPFESLTTKFTHIISFAACALASAGLHHVSLALCRAWCLGGHSAAVRSINISKSGSSSSQTHSVSHEAVKPTDTSNRVGSIPYGWTEQSLAYTPVVVVESAEFSRVAAVAKSSRSVDASVAAKKLEGTTKGLVAALQGTVRKDALRNTSTRDGSLFETLSNEALMSTTVNGAVSASTTRMKSVRKPRVDTNVRGLARKTSGKSSFAGPGRVEEIDDFSNLDNRTDGDNGVDSKQEESIMRRTVRISAETHEMIRDSGDMFPEDGEDVFVNEALIAAAAPQSLVDAQRTARVKSRANRIASVALDPTSMVGTEFMDSAESAELGPFDSLTAPAAAEALLRLHASSLAADWLRASQEPVSSPTLDILMRSYHFILVLGCLSAGSLRTRARRAELRVAEVLRDATKRLELAREASNKIANDLDPDNINVSISHDSLRVSDSQTPYLIMEPPRRSSIVDSKKLLMQQKARMQPLLLLEQLLKNADAACVRVHALAIARSSIFDGIRSALVTFRRSLGSQLVDSVKSLGIAAIFMSHAVGSLRSETLPRILRLMPIIVDPTTNTSVSHGLAGAGAGSRLLRAHSKRNVTDNAQSTATSGQNFSSDKLVEYLLFPTYSSAMQQLQRSADLLGADRHDSTRALVLELMGDVSYCHAQMPSTLSMDTYSSQTKSGVQQDAELYPAHHYYTLALDVTFSRVDVLQNWQRTFLKYGSIVSSGFGSPDLGLPLPIPGASAGTASGVLDPRINAFVYNEVPEDLYVSTASRFGISSLRKRFPTRRHASQRLAASDDPDMQASSGAESNTKAVEIDTDLIPDLEELQLPNTWTASPGERPYAGVFNRIGAQGCIRSVVLLSKLVVVAREAQGFSPNLNSIFNSSFSQRLEKFKPFFKKYFDSHDGVGLSGAKSPQNDVEDDNIFSINSKTSKLINLHKKRLLASRSPSNPHLIARFAAYLLKQTLLPGVMGAQHPLRNGDYSNYRFERNSWLPALDIDASVSPTAGSLALALRSVACAILDTATDSGATGTLEEALPVLALYEHIVRHKLLYFPRSTGNKDDDSEEKEKRASFESTGVDSRELPSKESSYILLLDALILRARCAALLGHIGVAMSFLAECCGCPFGQFPLFQDNLPFSHVLNRIPLALFVRMQLVDPQSGNLAIASHLIPTTSVSENGHHRTGNSWDFLFSPSVTRSDASTSPSSATKEELLKSGLHDPILNLFEQTRASVLAQVVRRGTSHALRASTSLNAAVGEGSNSHFHFDVFPNSFVALDDPNISPRVPTYLYSVKSAQNEPETQFETKDEAANVRTHLCEEEIRQEVVWRADWVTMLKKFDPSVLMWPHTVELAPLSQSENKKSKDKEKDKEKSKDASSSGESVDNHAVLESTSGDLLMNPAPVQRAMVAAALGSCAHALLQVMKAVEAPILGNSSFIAPSSFVFPPSASGSASTALVSATKEKEKRPKSKNSARDDARSDFSNSFTSVSVEEFDGPFSPYIMQNFTPEFLHSLKCAFDRRLTSLSQGEYDKIASWDLCRPNMVALSSTLLSVADACLSISAHLHASASSELCLSVLRMIGRLDSCSLSPNRNLDASTHADDAVGNTGLENAVSLRKGGSSKSTYFASVLSAGYVLPTHAVARALLSLGVAHSMLGALPDAVAALELAEVIVLEASAPPVSSIVSAATTSVPPPVDARDPQSWDLSTPSREEFGEFRKSGPEFSSGSTYGLMDLEPHPILSQLRMELLVVGQRAGMRARTLAAARRAVAPLARSMRNAPLVVTSNSSVLDSPVYFALNRGDFGVAAAALRVLVEFGGAEIARHAVVPLSSESAEFAEFSNFPDTHPHAIAAGASHAIANPSILDFTSSFMKLSTEAKGKSEFDFAINRRIGYPDPRSVILYESPLLRSLNSDSSPEPGRSLADAVLASAVEVSAALTALSLSRKLVLQQTQSAASTLASSRQIDASFISGTASIAPSTSGSVYAPLEGVGVRRPYAPAVSSAHTLRMAALCGDFDILRASVHHPRFLATSSCVASSGPRAQEMGKNVKKESDSRGVRYTTASRSILSNGMPPLLSLYSPAQASFSESSLIAGESLLKLGFFCRTISRKLSESLKARFSSNSHSSSAADAIDPNDSNNSYSRTNKTVRFKSESGSESSTSTFVELDSAVGLYAWAATQAFNVALEAVSCTGALPCTRLLSLLSSACALLSDLISDLFEGRLSRESRSSASESSNSLTGVDRGTDSLGVASEMDEESESLLLGLLVGLVSAAAPAPYARTCAPTVPMIVRGLRETSAAVAASAFLQAHFQSSVSIFAISEAAKTGRMAVGRVSAICGPLSPSVSQLAAAAAAAAVRNSAFSRRVPIALNQQSISSAIQSISSSNPPSSTSVPHNAGGAKSTSSSSDLVLSNSATSSSQEISDKYSRFDRLQVPFSGASIGCVSSEPLRLSNPAFSMSASLLSRRSEQIRYPVSSNSTASDGFSAIESLLLGLWSDVTLEESMSYGIHRLQTWFRDSKLGMITDPATFPTLGDSSQKHRILQAELLSAMRAYLYMGMTPSSSSSFVYNRALVTQQLLQYLDPDFSKLISFVLPTRAYAFSRLSPLAPTSINANAISVGSTSRSRPPSATAGRSSTAPSEGLSTSHLVNSGVHAYEGALPPDAVLAIDEHYHAGSLREKKYFTFVIPKTSSFSSSSRPSSASAVGDRSSLSTPSKGTRVLPSSSSTSSNVNIPVDLTAFSYDYTGSLVSFRNRDISGFKKGISDNFVCYEVVSSTAQLNRLVNALLGVRARAQRASDYTRALAAGVLHSFVFPVRTELEELRKSLETLEPLLDGLFTVAENRGALDGAGTTGDGSITKLIEQFCNSAKNLAKSPLPSGTEPALLRTPTSGTRPSPAPSADKKLKTIASSASLASSLPTHTPQQGSVEASGVSEDFTALLSSFSSAYSSPHFAPWEHSQNLIASVVNIIGSAKSVDEVMLAEIAAIYLVSDSLIALLQEGNLGFSRVPLIGPWFLALFSSNL